MRLFFFVCFFYLVLTFSHSNNKRFQDIMLNIYKEDKTAFYQSAPVKTYSRCIIKSNTDYNNQLYPTSSCILDLLRCSITFNNIISLLNGIKRFKNLINNNEVEGLIKILRIKNGFNNILKWNLPSDSEYCDIKFNVLYENENQRERQIVEIQFLLNSLLISKKFGHKYYGIVRRKLFVHSVDNILFKTNYNQYKNKIITFVKQNNIEKFSKEILLKQNIIASILHKNSLGYEYPLLYFIFRFSNSKLSLLFLSFLFYFNDIILSQNLVRDKLSNNDKIFAKQYINFNKLNAIVNYEQFV